jgi:hypothetical protein
MNGGRKEITSKEFRGFRWNWIELSAYSIPRRYRHPALRRSHYAAFNGRSEMVRLFEGAAINMREKARLFRAVPLVSDRPSGRHQSCNPAKVLNYERLL